MGAARLRVCPPRLPPAAPSSTPAPPRTGKAPASPSTARRPTAAQLAATLGWEVVAVHVDNDLSAYNGKARPGYQALLDDLRGGRADAVLCWHGDRLHRRPLELEEYIAICEPRQVPTMTVRAGPVDLSTPSGRAVARTVGAGPDSRSST